MTESPSLSSLLNDVRAILQEARVKAYAAANLRNFRQFYLTFADAGKHYALRSELSWTHWRHILDWPQSEGEETL